MTGKYNSDMTRHWNTKNIDRYDDGDHSMGNKNNNTRPIMIMTCSCNEIKLTGSNGYVVLTIVMEVWMDGYSSYPKIHWEVVRFLRSHALQ